MPRPIPQGDSPELGSGPALPGYSPGSMPSFYHATADRGLSFPALEGATEADIVIIGGGFAGLATAASLVERGVRDVMLLEAETIGHGASGRNGGFVFGGFSL